MKKVAVLTSGGDAPGMNAALRAVVRTSIYHGMEVMGVRRGYSGLLNCDFVPLDISSVADIIQRGGTILHTARCDEFFVPEGRALAFTHLREAGVEGLIVIGGDGTFRGALELEKIGMNVIGIPGTIDNDIPCTERTIGFDTAVNTVVDAINKIRDTATSHERAFVIEVMGRRSGFIALAAGLAGGAESIIIPEKPFDIHEIVATLKRGQERGKQHNIIIVAEGVSGAYEISKKILDISRLDTRVIVLGHIQRGGSPSAGDRILASKMGSAAVQLLLKGFRKRMVGIVGDEIKDFDLEWALSQSKEINMEDYILSGILAM
ncbi:6-phosphofructokinase [Dehalobacterium formicoaceticum]|uniref:ATP-dependent 6-phosphofructokinase n=1 Tax=Dehalobacterium formicoaceticum TaxID=51515 RepID=A0ABT1Y5C6_9FIRM|nr:6-phosphofructokinase [Dehalobacterium formicoaceticum]MCR6546082.1 6-phosphofructokinase [Dehalobacterium formicoaceticum]